MDKSKILFEPKDQQYEYLGTGSISSITTVESLFSYLHEILTGAGIFERYFIHFKDESNHFKQFCDSKTAHTSLSDFPDMLPDAGGFHSNLNAGLDKTTPVKLFNVADAVADGRIEPWIFFLHRLGIKEIVARYLNFGGRGIGVFWYVPKHGHHEVSGSLLALLSGGIASFLQIQHGLLKTIEVEQPPRTANIIEPALVTAVGQLMIGTGIEMQKLNLLIKKVAPSYATVLITGETGTGKELIANEIHSRSDRKHMPFIKVNCAALPMHLIESELFGHEKGSFTGAFDRRIGKFELANGGTLFLDEIGEMDAALQVKLLRVLQEREIERVGGSKSIKVNVRMIAATSRDLQWEVTQGRFRSDLYYRLNVFHIPVPPLRERMDDLPLLCEYFLSKHTSGTAPAILSQQAFQQIAAYHWPGNVRELEHFIQRSILVSGEQVLHALYLPETQSHSSIPSIEAHFKTLEEMEKDHLKDALRRTAGKISGKYGAAALLGLPPSTVSSKLIRFNIDREEFACP